MSLPTDATDRKNLPVTTGVLDYFPDALVAVAEVSKVGNDQHNPGQPLHWDKSKSTDHADCLVRHLLERGTLDSDGMRHSAKVAWRALALLQTELDAAQVPVVEQVDLMDLGPLVDVESSTPLALSIVDEATEYMRRTEADSFTLRNIRFTESGCFVPMSVARRMTATEMTELERVHGPVTVVSDPFTDPGDGIPGDLFQ